MQGVHQEAHPNAALQVAVKVSLMSIDHTAMMFNFSCMHMQLAAL